MSLFWLMSFTMLSAGAIIPMKPLPQMCLEPQYQPSQLSGFRTCWVKPPILSRSRVEQPWGAWTILHSPCPSPCTRMPSGPYCSQILFTSSATSVAASSQEMRTYLLLPRFCGFLSPLGSQSTRLSGYLIRLGEYARFLYARLHGAGTALYRGSRVLPFFVIFQGLNVAGSYLESQCRGLILTTLPSFTSTAQGQAPKMPPLRPSDLRTVFSELFGVCSPERDPSGGVDVPLLSAAT